MVNVYDQWEFILEQLKLQQSDCVVFYFPFESNKEYIEQIKNNNFYIEEWSSTNGYAIKIWK
jgi:hypothetical protein